MPKRERKAKRHKLILQSPPVGRDSLGQITGSWTEVGTFFASIKVLNGTEAERARKLYAEATIEIETFADSSAPITTEKRFLFGTRTFSIGFVNDLIDQHGQVVRVLCSEVR